MLISRNFTDPAKAFGKFQLPDGRWRYPSQHVRTVARQQMVKNVADTRGKIAWEMRVKLPFACDCSFTDKEGRPGKKYIEFLRTKEQHVFLELIEHGHDHVKVDPMQRDHDLRSTFGPPTNISVVSNSVMGNSRDVDVDDITVQFSVFGGTQATSRRETGQRSAMDWSSARSSSQWTYETVSGQSSRRRGGVEVETVSENDRRSENGAMPPPARRRPVVEEVEEEVAPQMPANPPRQQEAPAAAAAAALRVLPSASLASQVAQVARNRRGVVRRREDDSTEYSRGSKRVRAGGDAAVAAGAMAAQEAAIDEENSIMDNDSDEDSVTIS